MHELDVEIYLNLRATKDSYEKIHKIDDLLI